MSKEVVIVDGIRTPFCKIGGALKGVSAYNLGKVVVRELLERTELPAQEVDELVVGNFLQTLDATNVARAIARKAGIPPEIPAYTVQRYGGSGMQAITSAFLSIRNGNIATAIAAGAESISNYPLLFQDRFSDWYEQYQAAPGWLGRMRQLSRFSLSALKPAPAVETTMLDYVDRKSIGESSEVWANRHHINREAQDQYAALSHRRAVLAVESGLIADEVAPVFPQGEKTAVLNDDSIRRGQAFDVIKDMPPLFDADFGRVTAGNSAPLCDGAASLLLMTASRARTLGMSPLATIRGFAYVGVAPSDTAIGPAFAAVRALENANMSFSDIQLCELHESTSAVVLANEQVFANKDFVEATFGKSSVLGAIPRNRLNVNGGAISLGHSFGASGVRMVMSLMREMDRRNRSTGLAMMAIAGGQAGAIVLERR